MGLCEDLYQLSDMIEFDEGYFNVEVSKIRKNH